MDALEQFLEEKRKIKELAEEFREIDIDRIGDLYWLALFGVFNLYDRILSHEQIMNHSSVIAYSIVKDELKRGGYVASSN